MKKSNVLKVLVTGVLAGALAFGAGFPAQAASDEGAPEELTLQEVLDSVGEEARPLTSTEIAGLEAAGEIAPGEFDVQPFACGSWINAVALNTGWYVSQNNSCALAGDRTTRVGYTWERDSNAVGGSICVQGRGARIPASNPYAGGQLYWHAGGCAAGGSFTVDWQSSLHYKAVRHYAAQAPVWGVAFKWA